LKVVSEEEGGEIARLIERCLHLDPEHRSTAAELLNNPWFKEVE
jgi:hypothetical protein